MRSCNVCDASRSKNNCENILIIVNLNCIQGQIDEERYRRCFFALLTCNAKCEERERRRAEEGTVSEGYTSTVSPSTVVAGAVHEGTSSPGFDERAAVDSGTEQTAGSA